MEIPVSLQSDNDESGMFVFAVIAGRNLLQRNRIIDTRRYF